jgi:hypothetical protein
MTTMPKPSTPAHRALWGTLAAGALVLACESPRPDPVAPLDLGKDTPASQNVLTETSRLISETNAAIEKLRLTVDSLRLVEARLSGRVVVEAEMPSVVSEKLHETGRHSAESRVGRFLAEDVRIIGRSPGKNVDPTEVVILSSSGEELFARRLPEARAGEPLRPEHLLESIKPDDVKEIEVFKAAKCTSETAISESCNLLRVRLKPGVKLRTYQR